MTATSNVTDRKPMDAALRWDAAAGGFDLMLDADAADLLAEDTLLTAVVLSLLVDRTASADEVPADADRRGWWADAYSETSDAFGSRLWLLGREKQLQATLDRARAYITEALAWLTDDGMATRIDVAVFAPRMGWIVAQIDVQLDGGARRYRFNWSDEQQIWTLAGNT